jgi:uncharacterized protein
VRGLAAALILAVALPAAARTVPPLTGPVVDEAGILGASDRAQLEALCRAAWALPPERRVQLQYLLVKSLEGDAVEDLAVRAFEAWKLGERGRDRGVLVVVALQDRRLRIETGYGAEGALTDAQAGRIIRNVVTPAFREGRYGEGLRQAGVQILAALGALPEGVSARRPGGRPGSGLAAQGAIALLVLFLVLSIALGRRRWGLWGLLGGLGGSRWGGGGWGGGGFGGGGGWGGGGGGWSGGGGSSGGGGASGSW